MPWRIKEQCSMPPQVHRQKTQDEPARVKNDPHSIAQHAFEHLAKNDP